MQESVMNPTIIILTLILVGLAYIGAVQVYRHVRKRYLELTILWAEMKSFLRSRQKENRVITIKVHNQPPSPPPASPKRAEVQREVIDDVVVEPEDEEIPTDADYIPQEQLFISVEVDGEEYTLCENVTADELEQMSRTLSVKTAPINEEIVAANTICKLRDSPMLKDLIGITGNRVEELMKNVITSDSKIVKEGFDYSNYITK